MSATAARAAAQPAHVHASGEKSEALSRSAKCLYSLGDFSTNTVLATTALLYASYFLINVAGLRPALAGLVPLIGRVVDACTDPLMGRLSDVTRSRFGRRRPYFLLGAVPLGVTFALMWLDPGLSNQGARFAYYALLYTLMTVFLTVVTVPHLALQPEMVLDYDERTALTTYRNVGALVGVVAAIVLRPVVGVLGGGVAGFASAGIAYGVLIAVPWFAVWRVSFEREEFRTRPVRLGFVAGLRSALGAPNFVRVTALYLAGRISMDLVGAMLILYFTHYIGRSSEFELLMVLFLPAAAVALPVWLYVARFHEKVTLFRLGCLWWAAAQLLLLVAQPQSPRWLLMAFAPLAGIGYAVVDLMPWAMVGDVIDEDDLATGERREGLYHGVFLFVRKLGGALGVFAALSILDVAGLSSEGPQSPTTIWSIRLLTSLGPAVFLLLAVWCSRGYGLSRAEHARIRDILVEREFRRRQLELPA